MKRFIQFVVLGLTLLLVAMVSALTAMRFAIHGREVAVPKLLGMSASQAESTAHAAGLMLTVENRFYSTSVPEGRVVSQLPAPGEKVRTGWVVRVAQSLGPQHAEVPNLIGQSPRAAEINVRRRGLELASIATVQLDGATPGEIVAQTPPAHATGYASPKLNVLIAAPEAPRQFVMPSFIGKSLPEAQMQIEDAGFLLGKVADVTPVVPAVPVVSSPSAQPVKAGPSFTTPMIVRQSPAPGQKIVTGDTISLEVSR